MTSYQSTSFLNDIHQGKKISEGEKAYFRERLRNRLFDLVASEYARKRASGTLSQAEIGRRLAKSPVQISRWLSAPGNWTLDTVSDLLLAVSAAELQIGIQKIEESRPRNRVGPDWLKVPTQGETPAGVVTPGVAISSDSIEVGSLPQMKTYLKVI